MVTSSDLSLRPPAASGGPYTCWRHRQPVRADWGAGSAAGDSAGALPSNTAPAKYTDPLQIAQILAAGIDSLYLSYPGGLRHSWDFELEYRKRLARSPDRDQRSEAQVLLGDSLFRVEAFGSRRFAYILQGDFFRIEVSAIGNKSRPMAYVQIASELLWQAPLPDILEKLSTFMHTLGHLTGEPLVSRVDLCMDFVTGKPLHEIREEDWVCQAKKIRRYTDDRQFTGFDIGLGGSLSARLYNKSREIVESGKEFFKDLWSLGGWDSVAVVWRLEFEIKRERLNDFGINSVTDLLQRVQSTWSYCSETWLRLPMPNVLDSNRARWATDALWLMLQRFPPPDEFSQLEIDLRRKPCAPKVSSIYSRHLSVLTSYMAVNGLTDFYAASTALARETESHYNFVGDFGEESFRKLVSTHVRDKMRRFNIMENASSKEAGEDHDDA